MLMNDLTVASCVPVLIVANDVDAQELKAVRGKNMSYRMKEQGRWGWGRDSVLSSFLTTAFVDS